MELKSDDGITSTLTSPGVKVTVNEKWAFEIVVTGGQSTNTSSRTVNNTWIAGDDTYTLANGRINREFKNGNPSAFNNWGAQGTLTRNGMEIGRLAPKNDCMNMCVMLSADGKKIEVESFPIR